MSFHAPFFFAWRFSTHQQWAFTTIPQNEHTSSIKSAFVSQTHPALSGRPPRVAAIILGCGRKRGFHSSKVYFIAYFSAKSLANLVSVFCTRSSGAPVMTVIVILG